mmetsp:Transcript_109955/g.212860  ORF Transcript_109955/g.212860 Transcript_109955/m.212860 type:complete len:468 (-) Transcript_109955:90-1493(-)
MARVPYVTRPAPSQPMSAAGTPNSTVLLLQLWQLCVQSQGGGFEGSLQWSTLRRALDGLPATRCDALRCGSVDDLLRRHFGFQGTHGGHIHVNFARYWRGMEAMLQACGAFNTAGLEAITQQKVSGLRAFRDAVLDEFPLVHERSTYYCILDIRRLFERLRGQTGGPVAIYWEERLRLLPGNGDMVTADEVASAMCTWLRELLRDHLPAAQQLNGDDGHRASLALAGDSPSSSSGASVVDEPERERAPMGTQYHSSSAAASGHRIASAVEVPPSSFGGRGQTHLTPSSRFGSDERSPSAAGRPTPGTAEGVGIPAGWLAAPGVVPETLEVRHFREHLARGLSGATNGMLVLQLYRAVRDATIEAKCCAAGTSRVPFLDAATECLAGVVRRQLRTAMRDLEAWTARRSNRSAPKNGHGTIVLDLLCSQAKTAAVLERREVQVPPAHRIAWLLSVARRRILSGALERWR